MMRGAKKSTIAIGMASSIRLNFMPASRNGLSAAEEHEPVDVVRDVRRSLHQLDIARSESRGVENESDDPARRKSFAACSGTPR